VIITSSITNRHPSPNGSQGKISKGPYGIVKLSEFEQKLGNARIHNSLIVQHSGYWPEVENQLKQG